jgi:hypothetical protein
MHGHEALFMEFSFPYQQHADIEIDIRTRQRERFGDTQPGCGQ